MKKMITTVTALHITQVVIAIIGSWYAFATFLAVMLDPASTTILHVSYAAIASEIALLILGFVIPAFLRISSNKAGLLIFLICLSLIVAILPRITFSRIEGERARILLSDLSNTKADFLSKMAAREKDVRERIDQKRPYTTLETLDFIGEYRDADLSNRGLPNYSSTYETLLKQALAAKIVDLNSKLPKNFADGGSDDFKKWNNQPLYSYIYYIGGSYEYADSLKIAQIKNILQMFVDAGANTKLKDHDGKTIIDYIQTLSALKPLTAPEP